MFRRYELDCSTPPSNRTFPCKNAVAVAGEEIPAMDVNGAGSAADPPLSPHLPLELLHNKRKIRRDHRGTISQL